MVTHDGRKGWINRLAVLPEHRRKGVAKSLILESEKLLRRMGFEVFAVLIEHDRAESQELFEDMGYKREDEILYYAKRLRKDA